MPNVGVAAKSYPQLKDIFLSAGWAVVPFDLEWLRTASRLSVHDLDLVVGELTDEASLQRISDLVRCKEVPWLAIVTTGAMGQRAVELAAADVMFGPVNHHEVVWRAQRILTMTRDRLRVGGLTVNLTARVVTRNDRLIALSANEFRLLAYFARRCGQPIGRDEILSEVWRCSSESGGTRDQVNCCILRLRKKIERDPGRPEYLVSVKGSGYLLRNQEQWRQAQPVGLPQIDIDLTSL
jgi:DNA-binding response OmpR family regulator